MIESTAQAGGRSAKTAAKSASEPGRELPITGEVSTVASELGDPGGIVFDRSGALYVAETALHRIIRITGLR